MLLDEKKAKDYFQQQKACSLYTQLLGLEEAIENTAACVPHTSGSIVVLAMQLAKALWNCSQPSVL